MATAVMTTPFWRWTKVAWPQALGPIDRRRLSPYKKCNSKGSMKHFLAYRFDERERTLWRGTEEIRLTRKASAILQCLIEGAGRIVSHEIILSTVWPGTHVQADNIK